MSDILTVEEFCDRQSITFDPTNMKVVRAVQDAVAFVRGYTRMTITRVDDDTVALDGLQRSAVRLPQRPVIGIGSVTLLSLDNADEVLDPAFYRVDTADILWRLDGGTFESGPANVIVVYDHGYDTVPDDLTAATYELAAENYLTTGGGAVTSAQIGTAQVTFDASTVGSAELPEKAKYILDCYKDHR